MNNIKKAVLTSLTLAGLAIGLNAQAAVDPSAVVVWTGKVPTVNAGDSLLITGLGGSQEALSGALAPNNDGTFISPSIILEARVNDGSATTPVVGALTDASWTVKGVDVAYGGSAQTDQEVAVQIDGTDVEVNGTAVAGKSSISLTVSQSKALTADVGGKDVQAAVTLMATKA
ncbi:hypothetical protein [Vibrio parahaemolyticus]|uniref:Uncharacterized protein n=1 Tax=Vibrio parahaemolyticus TaxID=670 RepID=A0A024CAK8_VIBPH|nr:hypothetical protein [Vibrio parahaemolyticus]AHZ30577.1 hypothetical protein tc_PAI_044 [Vibrio parahaemolyticus]AWG86255.1 hypothetical protein Vp2S01_A0770 [Vibrio parahaemolyticus]KFE93171.1 hypothetical protein HB39_23745 [Vibrio parahaemolyticus]MBE4098865.1 hypothetical protein [Vibrio parahaemolyticus]MBE4134072.1 hypothetical protein [Vibrio parahaemolyticus]